MKNTMAMALALLANMSFVNAQVESLGEVVGKLYPLLSSDLQAKVVAEVRRNELLGNLGIDLDAIDQNMYEMVSGFVHEAAKYIIPKKQFVAQTVQGIFDRIERDKGRDALGSVKNMVKQLNAMPLEYIPTPLGKPVAIRITVPDQAGVSCGVHALANLISVQTGITSVYTAGTAPPLFTEMSEILFEDYFESCPKELVDVNFITKQAAKVKLSKIVLVGVDEAQDNKTYNYALIGGLRLNELLQQVGIIDPVANIVVHSKTVAHGKHSEHWSAVSVVKNKIMKEPVIVFMNSLGNVLFKPTNETLQAAIRYIAEEYTKSMVKQEKGRCR